jgi:hypothetical protein
MTFDENECYELFLAVDDRARELEKPPAALMALRERLMPVYIRRHTEERPELARRRT